MLKRPVPIIIAALLLIAGAFLLRRCTNGTGVSYQTAPVTRGSITQAVTATGTLNPVQNVQVGSQVSGNIQKLFADFNTVVKAGQVIAQIDPVVFQANVNQAEGEVANARAALELARLNEARTRGLVAKQNSAQSDLDQVTAALHQAEANLKIKEGALQKAQADLDHCTITSPIDGIVISRNVDVGQTVAASLQAPVIFAIANDLSKMQIDANVAEADVGAVAVDQDVEFTVDAFPSRTFQGKVVQVRNAPITVQNVVTYDTVIGVSNPEQKLKPGMTANVSIVAAHRDSALKIPNSALRFRMPDQTPNAAPRREQSPGARQPGGRRGGGDRTERRTERTVYVLAAGSSKPTPVSIKTGISDGIGTEVLEGLKEGDRIVTGMTDNDPGSTPATNPFSGGSRRRF
ncbi:MAG TPA: efflux RND transporter periplasmic adaptor subunit [Chthoniobacterales bacterium]|jgi:HlyD family secretion protein|nr:efflux RND transporter periplasmic adaptor subunit [Chthoniobacterales bacterium]